MRGLHVVVVLTEYRTWMASFHPKGNYNLNFFSGTRCRFSPGEPAPTGPPCPIIDVIEDPQHVEDDQVPVEGEGVAVSVENILCQKHLVGQKYLDLLSKAMLAITMASISRAFPWAWSNFEVTD